MARDSLKAHQLERDKQKKETKDAVTKLSKTQLDVERVADKIGKIHSDLKDVNEAIRAERNRVLDSGEKVSNEDAGEVEAKEEQAAEHRKSVEDHEQKTIAEKEKAQGITPLDSRIQDGSNLAKHLDQTRKQLAEMAKDLQAVESDAKSKRKAAQQRIAESIKRNRK